MKLWTIQPIKFYEQLISKEEISSSEEYVDNTDFDFKKPYEWMVLQMESRIGLKPKKDCFPIWAWFQYKSNKRRKPDLRNSCLLKKGTKGVRIEFVKRKNEVLLSDFDLWHFVLNYWHIADDERQGLEFDKLLEGSKIEFVDKEKYTSELKKIVENSWSKIFDLDYDCDYVSEKFESKKIQATFWNLKISEITKVDFFTAK